MATASNQQMQSQLAPNFWTGRANDNLAAADPYTTSGGNSIINSIQSAFNGFDFSINDVLRGGAFIAQNIPLINTLSQAAQGAASLSGAALTARILATSNIAKSALSAISDSSLGEISSFIANSGRVYASINQIVQRVGYTNFNDMRAVGNLINSVTGNSGLFAVEDQDSTVGLLSGIIHEATRYGIPNSYLGIIATVSNASMVNRITQNVLPGVIQNSDTYSLTGIGTQMGNRGTYALNQNVLTDFSSAYTLPLGSDTTQCYQQYTNLMTAYTAVDTSWNSYTRNTTAGQAPCIDLTTIQNGSQDFNSTINLGSQAAPAGSVDKVYQLSQLPVQKDVNSALATSFPQTVIRGNQQIGAKTLDPVVFTGGGYMGVDTQYLQFQTTPTPTVQ